MAFGAMFTRCPTTCAWIACVGACILLIALRPPDSLAQDQDQDRAATLDRLEALQEQIDQDRERLEAVEAEEQSALERLDDLRREITLREELIETYGQRLAELEHERDSLQAALRNHEQEAESLREQYRERATHAYKHGRQSRLALVLAAESINEMLVRAQYLMRFAEQRRTMLDELSAAMEELEAKRQNLQDSEEETQSLLTEAERERTRLDQLQQDEQQTIAELRDQQEEIEEDVEAKQQAAAELEERLRAMAAEGEADGAESAFDRAELSASFEDNEGRLPWPTDGVITEGFGEQTDPVHGTRISHPGILIATNPNENVYAVFDGTVVDVDFIPGYGTYIVIRHGDYMSAYSNFSDLYVSRGDTVHAGQRLGTAGTEDDPRGAGLFFAVYAGDTAVDPTRWLDDP